jgi:RNA polymerase sigma factor (sigma-70 family)
LQGDAESLYRLHHVRLVWAVRASVKAPTETIEDACSFAWLQLMRTEPEGGPKLFAWLRTVAIHEAIRLAKRDAHFGNNDAEQNVDARLIDLNTAVEARETARAIGSLRERQRRILLLHLAGYSYKEIAEHTGDTVRTVERQLLRGRQRLRGYAA